MNNYTVYMHIFPNKKRYIGITATNVKKRWLSGYGYRGSVVGRAIQKYGWDNIKHEIFFENLAKEEAEQKEIELIEKYKTNQKAFGYNIANGGNHKGKVSEITKQKISKANKNHEVTFETRKKISLKAKQMWENPEIRKKIIEKCKGRTPWNKGIPQSEHAKKLNSEKHIGKRLGEKGKPLSDEAKKKISLKNKGHIPWNKGMKNKYKLSDTTQMIENSKKAKKVICIETQKIYSSARQCALDMNLQRSSITRVCNKQLNQTGSYHFEWYNAKTEYNIANAIFN